MFYRNPQIRRKQNAINVLLKVFNRSPIGYMKNDHESYMVKGTVPHITHLVLISEYIHKTAGVPFQSGAHRLPPILAIWDPKKTNKPSFYVTGSNGYPRVPT